MSVSMLSGRASGPFVVVMSGGLLAATLDIVHACTFWAVKSGVPPFRILQSVAAGVLGEASFEGGAATAAVGWVLHYLIVLAMALVYYVVASRWFLLQKRPFRCGAAYGLLLYGVMNYVVVPLSKAGTGPQDPLWITLSIVVNVLLIGVPIALFARAALKQQPAGS